MIKLRVLPVPTGAPEALRSVRVELEAKLLGVIEGTGEALYAVDTPTGPVHMGVTVSLDDTLDPDPFLAPVKTRVEHVQWVLAGDLREALTRSGSPPIIEMAEGPLPRRARTERP